MDEVGKIKQIWRFPVKSMGGATLPSCKVSATGVLGDRVWAMRDETRKEVQWGKRFPKLMQCEAVYCAEPEGDTVQPVEVLFPDGTRLRSGTTELDQKLSDWLGVEAKLWPIQPASDLEFYKRYKPDEEQFQKELAAVFAREEGEPLPDFSKFPEIILDHVAVPGTFFDNEEIHLITTASLISLAEKNPSANWDVRRFRPNFLIESRAGLDGLVENDWVGRQLKIGEVVLEITMPTPRCGMTVQAQAELEFDNTVLRTIVREANQALGVGAHCLQAGRVSVGDTVELI